MFYPPIYDIMLSHAELSTKISFFAVRKTKISPFGSRE